MIDWQPIETAPKDGSTVLVCFETAGVQIVHLAWYDSPTEWEWECRHGVCSETLEEFVGWWSYTRGSVTQEKLDDWLTTAHWAPWNGPQEDKL